MTKQSYVNTLLAAAIGLTILGIALRMGIGEHWFSLFGWPLLALVATIVIAVALFRRYPKIGLRRWPTLFVLLPAALIALIQIVFWTAFFITGPDGLGLGLARSMTIGYIDAVLPGVLAVLAALIAWLVYRGASQQ
ncbi:MAG: hypothetical protein K0U74_09080 [Alphaproteobacteria bacterium]|nr:hypothetical protein [Alphaproteobacteria bacterium]